MSSITTAARIPKIVERLNAAVEGRRFYEAHQLYKTIYFRCLSRQNFIDAIQHLQNGSVFLLEHQQWESGLELSNLLIKTYREKKIGLTANGISNFIRIYKLMRPSGRERAEFAAATATLFGKPEGIEDHDDLLHQFYNSIGRILWQDMNFEEARLHLMRSEDGFTTGCLLVEFHLKRGFPSELDMFIAQAVLQYLCMQKLAIATLAFHTYTRRHPNIEPGPPFATYPLLNFIWFLMMAVKSKSSISVFRVLVEKYSPCLERDPDYPTYLERIGQLYFGIAKPQDSSTNMFSSIMNMFGGAASMEDVMNDMNGMDFPLPEEMD